MTKTPPPSLEMALVPSRAADEAQPGDFGAGVLDEKLVLHPNVHDQLMAAQIDVTNAAHFVLSIRDHPGVVMDTFHWSQDQYDQAYHGLRVLVAPYLPREFFEGSRPSGYTPRL